MVLTQSCYVMEGCAMVLILLLPLQLVYSSWPVTTICRPTAWLGQYSCKQCYITYASCYLLFFFHHCTLGSLFCLVVPTVAFAFPMWSGQLELQFFNYILLIG